MPRKGSKIPGLLTMAPAPMAPRPLLSPRGRSLPRRGNNPSCSGISPSRRQSSFSFSPPSPAPAHIATAQETAAAPSTQGAASVDASAGVWTIKGSGSDLWGTEDDFEIVAKSLPGDGSVTTKLLGAESGMDLAKVGVMMRDD